MSENSNTYVEVSEIERVDGRWNVYQSITIFSSQGKREDGFYHAFECVLHCNSAQMGR